MLVTERGLICVGDVEEAVVVLALVIDFTHKSIAFEYVTSVDKEVETIFLRHLYALADDKRELVCCQIVWHQVSKKNQICNQNLLVLVDVG